MDSRNLVLLLAAALLISGCVSPPPTATPTPEPTPAPTPTPAPRCGDSACNGNEGSLANCCTDCGCQANYVCDNTTKACHPDARYLRDIAAAAATDKQQFTESTDVVFVDIVASGMGETRNTTRGTKLIEANLAQRQMHTRSQSPSGVNEDYTVDGTYYFEFGEYGWVKRAAATSFWSEVNDSYLLQKKVVSKSDASYLGNGTSGGEACQWVSLSPSGISDLELKLFFVSYAPADTNYSLVLGRYCICVRESDGRILAENTSYELRNLYDEQGHSATYEAATNYSYGDVVIILPSAVRNAQQAPSMFSIGVAGLTPADERRPFKGSADAPIVIVEYSSYQCPYCKRAEQTIAQVLAAYPGDVRLVFKNFPLDFHENDRKAAEAAECAADQGKFWEMHDMLYANQETLDTVHLKAYAQLLGLNATQFNSCLDRGAKAALVESDLQDGTSAGVEGTPTFFVNSNKVVGAQPFSVFKAAIDQELWGG